MPGPGWHSIPQAYSCREADLGASSTKSLESLRRGTKDGTVIWEEPGRCVLSNSRLFWVRPHLAVLGRRATRAARKATGAFNRG
jgi:hypothetical protein